MAIARLPKERGSIPLAAVPAIFACHQFIEGVVWLSQDGVVSGAYGRVAVLTYVLIAYALWPIYVPFSAYLLETDRRRRIIIMICQGVGLFVGLMLLLNIIRYPIGVSAGCCNLSYQVVAPEMHIVPYLLAVSIPFLISRQRSLALFGLGVALSLGAAAYLVTATAVPSVWCFFAAVLSGGLYLHFRYAARTTEQSLAENGYIGETA